MHNGEFAVVNQTVFYAGYSPEHGIELWRSDGSAIGTSQIADLLPGPQGGLAIPFADRAGSAFRPANITHFGAAVLFEVYTPQLGFGLWSYGLPKACRDNTLSIASNRPLISVKAKSIRVKMPVYANVNYEIQLKNATRK